MRDSIGKGDIPISDVHITILDLQAFFRLTEKSERQMASVQRVFDFPLPTHYSGLLRRLYLADVEPTVLAKSYSASIRARNGNFYELLRLRRVGRAWLLVKRVSASYWDKTMGLVLEEIDKEFPKDVLSADKDWHEFDHLNRLEIQ
jgi:hypothetical protein